MVSHPPLKPYRNHQGETAETINETAPKLSPKPKAKPRNQSLRDRRDGFAPLARAASYSSGASLALGFASPSGFARRCSHRSQAHQQEGQGDRKDLHSNACALTAASSQVRQGGHARSHRPCCYVIGGHAAKAPETAALRAFVLVPQLRIRCREAVGNQHFGQRYHLASPRRPFMGAASKHSRPQCWKGQAHQGGVWAGVGRKARAFVVSNVLNLFRGSASKIRSGLSQKLGPTRSDLRERIG